MIRIDGRPTSMCERRISLGMHSDAVAIITIEEVYGDRDAEVDSLEIEFEDPDDISVLRHALERIEARMREASR